MAEEKEKEKINPKARVNAKERLKIKEYVVGGYTFKSKQEADEAKDEMNAIKYLSQKTDGSDAKQVYVLYNQIIDRQLFSTSIGINYLKELQQFLYNSPDIPNDKIKPIPIKSDIQAQIDRKRERTLHMSELHTLSIKVAKYKNRFTKVMILNAFLVIAIIAMFLILRTSSNSNIVNYEVNVQDKYASWASSLKAEEESVKAKEKELASREAELESKEAAAGSKATTATTATTVGSKVTTATTATTAGSK